MDRMAERSVFCDDGRITVFSYGSNSTPQLRARVGNPTLVSQAASAPGFARVFCLSSARWGGGGVASLAPDPSATTRGAMVELTMQEKRLLDKHEGGYREEVIAIDVAGERRSAIAYIAGRRGGGAYTGPMLAPPTPQYLTAIHCMLREHWDMDGQPITVRSCEGGGGEGASIVVKDEWLHPGVRDLSLCALCVEINARHDQDKLWVMPLAISQVVAKLEAIGCDPNSCASQLLEPRFGGAGLDRLNERLAAAGQKTFGKCTLSVLQHLLC